ncbi:hypothetical protein EDB80DRAFT_875682 [Ilyonectria destructans]|nr:hypothetical protein EDB80DRAFT_875682 [Ilyonectria destructans]
MSHNEKHLSALRALCLKISRVRGTARNLFQTRSMVHEDMHSSTTWQQPSAVTHTINVGAGGFSFDPESLNADIGDFGSIFTVRINDSEPIFYYCSNPHSCVYEGMIGVINPNSTWTLQNQKRYLADTTLQLSPGEPYQTEGPPVESPDSRQGGRPVDGQQGGQQRLGISQVAGLAVGAAAALIGLAVIAAMCLYGRKILRLHHVLPH